jgi:hypothetical protein
MGLEALLEPVGPLPASTYWRRRLVSIAVVVIVLVVLTKSCGGGGKPKAGLTAGGATPAPSASATATKSAGARTSTTAAVLPCEDTQLALTVISDARTYPSGAPVKLTLTVTNSGPGPCTRDLSTAQRGFVVASGGVRTWSSTDCASPTPQVVTLKAKEPVTFTTSWSRKWSDAACSTATAARIAAAGTYTVTGVLGNLRKDGPVIVLSS